MQWYVWTLSAITHRIHIEAHYYVKYYNSCVILFVLITSLKSILATLTLFAFTGRLMRVSLQNTYVTTMIIIAAEMDYVIAHSSTINLPVIS